MDSGGVLSTASSSTATLTLLKPIAAAAAVSALPSSSSASDNGGGGAQQLTVSGNSTSTTNEHTPISSNSSSSSLNSLANAAATAATAAPPPSSSSSSGRSSSAVPSAPPSASSQQVDSVAQTMEKMSIDEAGRQSQSLRPRHPNSENTSLPSSAAPSSIFSPASASSAVSASADAAPSSASSSSAGPSNKKKAISYAAERVIGNGSFGVVYQATVIDTGETVAIKKVLQDRRFKNRELEIMSSLNHPNVVALKHCFYSKGEKPEEVYLNLVMEYIPETIHRTLRNHTKANKLVPVLYTKVYMYQIARALAYIHAQGICHRDIKPQNLLLNPKTHEVKLCDFGSAKCFAAGTRVRLYSGEQIAVEDVRGGELLMGDDGQPRIVTAGSLARGRAVMYRITPQWEGAEPFTVNGSHILVLVNNSRPAATQQAEGGWRVDWFDLNSNNVMTRQSSQLFLTEAEAAAHVRHLSTCSSAPIEWEVSVDDFLQAEQSVRDACQLFQSGPVSFASSPHSSLQSVLSSFLGLPASPPQIHWAAWYLGLCSGNDSSIAPRPLPAHVLSRCEEYTALFGQPASFLLSSAAQPASVCDFGTGSLANRLLDAYDLSPPDRIQRVPHAWLCDSLDVRRRILAGFLDSSCAHRAEGDCCTATVQHRSTAAGFKELAGSLGIRCGAISKTHHCNSRGGVVQDGFSVSFSGALSTVLQHTALPFKQHRSSQRMSADSEEWEARHCFGIASIAELPVSDYFGFAVHGGANHRFLLEDFTVSHNSLHPGEPNVSYICSRYYRAPELVFEATEYTAMIDVWSLGCVFVELLIGNPLFPGDSGVGQLIEIIKVLGSPSREEVLAMNPTPTSFRFPHISPQPWSKVFRNSKVPAAAIDLASRWLRYRPTDRLDPFDSLLHPFFDELREEGVRMPNGKELPELFEWKDSERDKMRKRGAAARLYERMTPAWYRRRRGEQVDEQDQDAATAAPMSQQTAGGGGGQLPSPSSSAASGEGGQRANGELLNGHRGTDTSIGAVAMDRDGP